MTQVHFTLETEEIQSLIEYSVKDDTAKSILKMVFHQVIEQQRTDYIQVDDYERSWGRVSQRDEKVLLASMVVIYVSGVSTRKVSYIVEELCRKTVSKTFVSYLNSEIEIYRIQSTILND